MLRAEDVNRTRQTDLDEQGIAKTAREEKKRARDEKLIKQQADNARMAQLYREHVLGEKPQTEGLVQIGGIASAPAPAPAPAKKVEEQEEVGSFGD